MAFGWPFFIFDGSIPCTTKSILESKENCRPDIKIPRTLRRIAGESWFWNEKILSLALIWNQTWFAWQLTVILIPAYALAKNSSASNMAANDPFTIFGDIGELASSKLEPKASFFSFVSWKEKLEEKNLKTLRQL